MRRVWRGITQRYRVAVLATALPLAALLPMTAPASALETDGWAMAHYGPARVGYNPHETLIGVGNAGTLTESWGAPIGTDILTLEPVVANGLAYVSDGQGSDTITAYNLSDGSVAWTAVGANSFAPDAVIGPDLWVTTVSSPGTVEELNALTGAVLWSVASPHGGTLGEPAVSGNVVYAFEYGADFSGWVDAFSATNGSYLWQAPDPGDLGSTLAPAPAVSGGQVYILGVDTTNHVVINAFNAASGHEAWAFDTHTKDVGWTISPATVSIQSDDVIFGYSSHVWSIKASSGHVRWTHSETGADYTQPMEAYSDLFTFNGSHDEALNQNTGHVVWTSSTPDIDVTAVADQVIFGTTTSVGAVHVKAISALDGSLLWTSPAIASTLVEAPIIVADGVVLAIGINSADNPVLYEFAPS